MILPRAVLQHRGDALMQPGQGLAFRIRYRQAAAQTVGQGHFQQITAWMGGEPGLQVGIDAVGKAKPGAAMHAAALLGCHHVAGDFSLDLVAGQQQVVRGFVVQAGKGNVEARVRCAIAVRIRWNTGISVFCPLRPRRSCSISRSRPRRVSSAAICGISAAIGPSNASVAEGSRWDGGGASPG